jgi:ABC-2 type transport system ATP-binding protein
MIVIENISKKINHKITHDSISLEFSRGVHCIMGKNGAGKSILLKMIAGVLPPDSGSVFYDDMDLYSSGAAPRRTIGYLPEIPELYDFLTVKEYLGFVAGVKQEPESRIDEFLEPLSLADSIHKKIKSLSNGMKRKVMLTACLMGHPEHLILDEPFNALDHQAVVFLKDVIHESIQKQNRVIVFSAHRIEFSKEFQCKCYQMDQGRIKKL